MGRHRAAYPDLRREVLDTVESGAVQHFRAVPPFTRPVALTAGPACGRAGAADTGTAGTRVEGVGVAVTSLWRPRLRAAARS
ncbi:hypothetical protein ABZ820_15525 [Streptomyces diacarni]|uniref:hypothetical protein n=1 Tax=Streptomyces diacarni TaxID=2800381 RepID=UPI0033E42701